MTNREYIEGLNDEQLTNFIVSLHHNCFNDFLCELCAYKNTGCLVQGRCLEGVLVWLKEEHKDD